MEKNEKQPIRVLHILQRMEAAGVQTLLMNLYRSIDRSKVQFDFLVHYKEHQFFDNEIEALGGRIYRLSVREDYNFFKYCKELDAFFEEHHEYRIVHGHMNSLGAIYLHYAKKHGIPVRIAHSHTNSIQNDLKKYIKQIMNRFYKRDATDLFACSKDAGKYMFGNEHFTVINNAILTDLFLFSKEKRVEKRKELGLEDEFVVGNVGRFAIVKNQKFLIDVFRVIHKMIPHSKLLLIGTGNMLEEVKEKVKKLDLSDAVSFLGNRKDVAELYMAMDVFVLPSLFEGLGIVAVEAQAAGTPCVCTDTLPKEIDVTPLLYRMSLEKGCESWAKVIIMAKENTYAHKNMRQYIVDANYDMAVLAKYIEAYYMRKWSER